MAMPGRRITGKENKAGVAAVEYLPMDQGLRKPALIFLTCLAIN